MITLSPILIIGTTIVIIMLSISYCRHHFKHALLAIIGLILSGVSSFCSVWQKNPFIHYIDPLIYTDNTSVLYTVLIIIASLVSSISVYTWLLHYPTNRRDEFYLLLLISSMGGILLTMSNHLIMLFLGIELITLPLFGLIGYSVFQKSSIESSIKYVLLSGISSGFLLFGIALVYAATSYLSFYEIKEALSNYSDFSGTGNPLRSTLLTVTGFMMIMVGFSFKLSIIPFHLWTPEVYQHSVSPVSMYLATGSKVAVISVLIRFLLILPDQYHKIFYIFLSSSACCSMLFGSIMAIQQSNIKRILAYSSITNSGYLLIAIIALYMNHSITQEAIGMYLISYIFATIGVFSVVHTVSTCYVEKENLDELILYRGLFWKQPVLSIVLTIILLSLSGIPMTLGFIGKFYLLLTGISSQLWLLIIVMVISGIISIFFYLKMIVNLYLSSILDHRFDSSKLNNWFYQPNGIIIIITTIIIVVFGVYPQPIMNLMYYVCV